MAVSRGAMHVAKIKRRHGDSEYVSHLVRRSVREGKRVRHETVANVSKLPAEAIEALTLALRGVRLAPVGEAFQISRSLPHGHVQAVLAAARALGFQRLLDREPSRQRDLALALICERVLDPQSKLASARALQRSTLAAELGVQGADEDDLYGAMDWLAERQDQIEDRLARRHLTDAELVLYDVSSSYFEGHTCPLAKLGYSRDGKRGTLQIIYGLLCDQHGRPIAIEVFQGALHDDKTLPAQISKLKGRFGLLQIVLSCDRGMITKANIQTLKDTEGVGFISALKAPQIKRLVRDGDLQLSLFDEQNLAEITSESYPSERLVVCRNPLVGAERTRKREDLLAATERDLKEIARRVQGGTLKGAAQIGLAVGPALKRYRVKKHFEVKITEESFEFSRRHRQIAEEAALDGIYVLRTSVQAERLSSAEVVRSYKLLEQAERAFRTLKGPELQLRPIGHRLEHRVRAHVFLCMLAYYLTWHLREAWTELLFKDEEPPVRADPVAKAKRSPQAERKAHTKRTARGEPAHSLRSLLADLATLTRNTVRVAGGEATFEQLSESTDLQAHAFALVAERIPQLA